MSLAAVPTDPVHLFLSGMNIGDVGLAGLVTLTVLFILTGRLVPRSQVNDWKAAYSKEREAGAVRDEQISALIQANRVAVRALDALPSAPAGGEPDVATTEPSRPTP